MKSIQTKIILAVVLSFISSAVFSQDLNLFLHNIEEDRFTGDIKNRFSHDTVSKITLTTMVNGLELGPYHLIKVKEIKAVDDKGNALKVLKDPFHRDTYHYRKKVDIILGAPTRQATKIKVVEGSFQYFAPTEENKGRAIVRDILSRKNENLLAEFHPEIELILVEPDRLQKKKEAMEKKFEAEVERRKKEGEIGEEEENEIRHAKQFLEDILNFNENYPDKALNFYLKDKKGVIYQFNIFNERGKKINTGFSSIDNIYQIHLEEKPTPGCTMEILIENKNAVKELKFELNNIILP